MDWLPMIGFVTPQNQGQPTHDLPKVLTYQKIEANEVKSTKYNAKKNEKLNLQFQT